MTNPYGAYAQNNISGASKGDQVASLLNRAAQHVTSMKQYIENQEYESSYESLEKSVDIMMGLIGWLDTDSAEAKPMVGILENYYAMIIDLTTKASIKNDTKLCDAAIKSLREMAIGWREIEASYAAPRENTTETTRPSVANA